MQGSWDWEEEQGRSRLGHEGVKPAVTCSIACWLANQLSLMLAIQHAQANREKGRSGSWRGRVRWDVARCGHRDYAEEGTAEV